MHTLGWYLNEKHFQPRQSLERPPEGVQGHAWAATSRASTPEFIFFAALTTPESVSPVAKTPHSTAVTARSDEHLSPLRLCCYSITLPSSLTVAEHALLTVQ